MKFARILRIFCEYFANFDRYLAGSFPGAVINAEIGLTETEFGLEEGVFRIGDEIGRHFSGEKKRVTGERWTSNAGQLGEEHHFTVSGLRLVS